MATRMNAQRSALRRTVVAIVAVGLALSGCSDPDDGARAETDGPTTTEATGGPGTTEAGPGPDIEDGVRIEVVSSQPDRVTGPDARIRIFSTEAGDPEDLRVSLAGQDVTEQLPVVDGHREGVVTGLVEGTNTLTATAAGTSATQRIRSWPLTGPMISGPQQPLLACSTEEHGLGSATDDHCSAPTRVSWRYVSNSGQVHDLPDPSQRPEDVATATIDGEATPLFVRYEQGVVNRSVYEIATIDPTPGGSDRDQSDAGWNGRLLYRYGGTCGATFGQGRSDLTALDPAYLAKGYALATATFNDFDVQCNDVLSAETTMMVKERFIEAFGEPELTIAEGTGGGAAQVHLIAQNYPGLFDGGVALQPLPDLITVASGAVDCSLLQRYYGSPAGAALTPEQRTAINGHATAGTCGAWDAAMGKILDPTLGCDPKADDAAVYQADANAAGVRCTIQDANANQLGRDLETGFAFNPLDNVGVQYGLEALNGGVIDLDQFLALNRAIGGFDVDGAHRPERLVADPEALAAAYETGRVATGTGDLAKIPIIEVSAFGDPSGDIHDQFRAFSLRDRLVQGGSSELAPGLQIWTRPASADGGTASGPEAVAVIDKWLTAIRADTESGDRLDVLTRNRPEEAVDNCILPGSTTPVGGLSAYDESGPCTDAFPVSGDPRIAAGAPRADDVLKCQLKPVDPNDYRIDLTIAQYDNIVAVFPEGVCDWGTVGIGQTTPSLTDRSYEDVVTPEQLA